MSSSTLPAGWQVNLLRDLATIKKGTLTSAAADGGGVPYLGAESLGGGSARMFTQTTSALMVEPTDVVMLWDGERSGLCGTGLDGAAGSTLARLRPKPAVDPRFLYWALARQFDYIQAHRTGTGVPHVPKDLDTFLKLQLPTEVREQRQIVGVLDTVEETIRSTERLIAKLEKLKQGVLHDLLSYGIDEHGALRDPARHPSHFVQSSLGVIPAPWSSELLSSVARITSGTTPPRGQARFWAGGSIPWVKTGEIAFNVIVSTSEYVTPIALAETSLRLLPIGSLLIAMYGEGVTRGRCALLGVPATTNQACAAIEPDRSRVSARFLFHYLQANYERIRDLGQGSHQTNLSGALLGRMEVVVPPLSEQGAIADAVDDLDLRVRAERLGLGKLRDLKCGLMDDLLTGRVRVNVDNEHAA